MSLADTMLADGFSTHLTAVHGDRFQVVKGPAMGSWFVATTEKDAVLELDTPVTRTDPRELVILHVARGGVPVGLEKGNIVFGPEVGGAPGSRFELVRREDNPSEQTVDFWAVKVVAGKDK